ncbi:MAG: hypothetical protein ACWA6X_07470 [Bauldia sp.]
MRVEKAEFQSYKTYLTEAHRPPSRGGNTRAWHSHVIEIGSERYSFLAADARKWVHKGELVSFDWEWSEGQKYRNINRDTVIAWNKRGEVVDRGNREWKRWRTATMPDVGGSYS